MAIRARRTESARAASFAPANAGVESTTLNWNVTAARLGRMLRVAVPDARISALSAAAPCAWSAIPPNIHQRTQHREASDFIRPPGKR